MMAMRKTIRTLFCLALLASAALAVPEGWHASLDDGRKAARQSGKPILVVTAWAPNI
jgi:hypothetical protein